jgi:hypothetical protein
MPVLRHHSNRPFPHFGEYLSALALPPSSQGIVSPAIPGRFTQMLVQDELGEVQKEPIMGKQRGRLTVEEAIQPGRA